MSKLLPYLLFFLFQIPQLFGQTTIKGKITDKKGEALPGANVFIKGTYDGASSDSEGNFSFRTSRKDTATLAASFVGYENFEQKIKLNNATL
ncbi:carboxypeptidase-like regulatory domain-containing protein, partial [Escherichia coli]|nr:carboxypeptidase-like regulatory domain-containing protein [Escherichia coli]